MTPHGWYSDPVDSSIERYWDGTAWTPATRPKSPVAPRSGGPLPAAAPRSTAKTATIWKVCGAAFALVVLLNVVSGLGDDDKPTNATRPSASRVTSERVAEPLPTSADTPGIAAEDVTGGREDESQNPRRSGLGVPVRDGDFEFVVSGWNAETATASLTVTNIGDSPGSLAMSSQYLVDDLDRRFEPEFDWSSDLAYADLNPGQSVSGSLSYVLSGAVPERLELHDSVFSGGVDVFLR